MSNIDISKHWKYFISLEKDLIKLEDYIEINRRNFATNSIELSKILQLSCGEIDSVCRILCKEINPSTDFYDESIYSGNISQYKKTILSQYPLFTKTKIEIPSLKEKILPFEEWEFKDSPNWWKDYNRVKHYRHSEFEKANLHNVLYSMASLFILILYLNRITGVEDTYYMNLLPSNQFFECEYTVDTVVHKGKIDLPDFNSQ